MKTAKPHAVLVPYPSQGHVTPMMRLAKLLHSRGFYITFVNTEYNHSRLIRSKGPDSVKGLPDFKFETIPDGMPPSDGDSTQDVPLLCDRTRKTCLLPFKALLSSLNSSPNAPRVTCVISDGVMSFAIRAAEDIGIPEVQFWTASACSFIGYLHYRELIKRGIFPLKNDDYLTDGTLDTPIDWMTGLNNICLKDVPSFIRTTDPNDIMFDFMGEEAQNCLKAPAIIFNTFYEFEQEALQAVISKFNFPKIYTVGPLSLLGRHFPESQAESLNSSLWKTDSKVFEWLDIQKPESVVYVNYGSVTTMSGTHFQEFAWGLANSKQPFLWIVRPDVVKDGSAMLPEEFLEEIKDRGLLISWCAQDQVLEHPAVGSFLTHCGWNSMMESICAGVPVICWPFFADQQTNCYYSCSKWGIGMEIDYDVKRDEVAQLVREMMGGEKGEKMRIKAKEWKKIAQEATDVGGSSHVNFDKFIKEALHFQD
ncbi:7-deoxyloganetin glucosyltransferase-like [Olea europaea subsp. europaea]|uniref:7-deoxyloganetin glucosyltransferase n=1 Tax=Olea europaea subsp. europaea TaxID=158383 RepID=A0A8S0VK21_OLEEU|nr:7-deoxyloganetin glucosyltransferase-like [Olea europaea subsp. europaea]